MCNILFIIITITGQLVFQKQLDTSLASFVWTPEQQQDGFYIYHIQDKEGVVLQQGKLVYVPK